jgi:hypothetical protein
VKELQQIAVQLDVAATQMAGYHDLPMGRHDEHAMTHPKVEATFQMFVNQKQELLALLKQTAERDNDLLKMMRVHNR